MRGKFSSSPKTVLSRNPTEHNFGFFLGSSTDPYIFAFVMLNSREIGTCVGRYDSFFAFEKITNHVVIVFEADLLFIHTFCRQVVFFPIKIQTTSTGLNFSFSILRT
ncbi:hypothetical protein LBBP_03212 [Leptospira borgpetersenii serovar Ballum]|uniref:Uncharacterized protein n=1 Tax=Leptospira borgpetersenii serovar Ballum TaxID=280505 RepID=A0A0S2IUT9_LEPBO|nr:hypothetical protein LBBP_03212 [Leptospira borgpetersenii serovar Ballum]